MGSNLDTFLRKKCFLFCFVHVVLLTSLEIMRKKYYSSRFILQGGNIIFKKKMLRVRCSLRKIKEHYMLIFWCKSHGNTVEKAKGSV